MTLRLVRMFALFAVVLAATAGARGVAQTAGASERFTAFALDTTDIGASRSGMIEIVLTRWSTDHERETLIATLNDRGAEALLDELRETPRVGYIRTEDSIGYDLRLSQVVSGEDGGRLITLLTDRPIGFWESAYQPRSIDYPFTWIELTVDRQGRGEGRMFVAARITGHREFNFIEIENFTTLPVRLMNVRSTRPSTW